MNIYRGCTHGCIYCDSRSRCYQINHDFEDVEAKRNACELLRAALTKKRRRCMISTGAMCDPYIGIEDELRLTRGCLEIICELGFGLAIQTKSASVLRDLDLLKEINTRAKCVVQMTLTTFDENLCRIVEPSVSTTFERFTALCVLREAGIPTVVWLTPLLPWINDTEENIRGILDYCSRAYVRGIIYFGAGMTLREGSREYYYAKLGEHFHGLSERYRRLYGNAYNIASPNSARLDAIFRDECRRLCILTGNREVFDYLREFPEELADRNGPGGQLSLF